MIDPTAVAGSSSGRPLLLLLPTKKIMIIMVYCKNENGRWYEGYCMALRVFEGLNSLPKIWQVGSCRLPMTKLLLFVEDCLTLCMGWTETKKTTTRIPGVYMCNVASGCNWHPSKPTWRTVGAHTISSNNIQTQFQTLEAHCFSAFLSQDANLSVFVIHNRKYVLYRSV